MDKQTDGQSPPKSGCTKRFKISGQLCVMKFQITITKINSFFDTFYTDKKRNDKKVFLRNFKKVLNTKKKKHKKKKKF